MASCTACGTARGTLPHRAQTPAGCRVTPACAKAEAPRRYPAVCARRARRDERLAPPWRPRRALLGDTIPARSGTETVGQEGTCACTREDGAASAPGRCRG